MDEDFFGDQTPAQQQQGYHPHSTGDDNQQKNADDEFDFGGTNYETPKLAEHRYSDPVQQANQRYSNSALEQVDNETIRKVQQQENRIRQKLRQKANHQHQLKLKTKQNGKKQLDDFLQKKQQETAQRKKENVQKQKQKLEQTKKLNDTAGWKKVAVNVVLKQGQNKGQKDITRMRQAIINKRQDQP